MIMAGVRAIQRCRVHFCACPEGQGFVRTVVLKLVIRVVHTEPIVKIRAPQAPRTLSDRGCEQS